jgi:hypothetical protein
VKYQTGAMCSGVLSMLAGSKLGGSRNRPPISGAKNTMAANTMAKTMIATRSLDVWYGWKATPSSGTPLASLRSLISMPSGLSDPVVCSARMWTTTSRISASGTATTCRAKKRFRVMSEMK